jgi:hypothetical protein
MVALSGAGFNRLVRSACAILKEALGYGGMRVQAMILTMTMMTAERR